jgi:hypothetical protein
MKNNIISSAQVELTDKLPLKMCYSCNVNLETAYKFYITCLETDSALKIQLEAENSENVSDFRFLPCH